MSAVNRFLIRLPRLLSKRLWAVPLAGALILGIVGLWVVKRVEETTRGELAARLQTLLQADVNALRLWFTERQYAAKSFASDARVEAAIMQLAALAQDPRATPQSLADSAPAQTLRHYLQPLLEAQEYLGYVVVAPDKRILATTGRARSGALPQVPTFQERGMGELTLTEGTWLLAPARTPLPGEEAGRSPEVPGRGLA